MGLKGKLTAHRGGQSSVIFASLVHPPSSSLSQVVAPTPPYLGKALTEVQVENGSLKLRIAQIGQEAATLRGQISHLEEEAVSAEAARAKGSWDSALRLVCANGN